MKTFREVIKRNIIFATSVVLFVAFIFTSIYTIYHGYENLKSQRDLIVEIIKSYVEIIGEKIRKNDALYVSFFHFLHASEDVEKAVEKASKFYDFDEKDVKVNLEILESNPATESFHVSRTKYDFEKGILYKSCYIEKNEKVYKITIEEKDESIKNLVYEIMDRIKEKADSLEDISIFVGMKNKIYGELELEEYEKEKLKEIFDENKSVIISVESTLKKLKLLMMINPKKQETIIAKVIINKMDMLTSIILGHLGFLLSFVFAYFVNIHVSKNVSKSLSQPLESLKRKVEKLEIFKPIEKVKSQIEEIKVLDEKIDEMKLRMEQAFIEIRNMTEKLKESYSKFSKQLAKIAEHYDEETGVHIIRVGELSAFIAEKMNMPKEFVEKIREAAPLHDIGKILVEKRILTKRGKLTDEEFEEIKKHTIYGKTILEGIEEFEMAKNIALYHHEKHDGSGYPFGLKGDVIPIEAAIVSLVDVYDALRSERPYKKAFTAEQAYKIIVEGDGRTLPQHFKPEVLEIFKKHIKDIENLWEKISGS